MIELNWRIVCNGYEHQELVIAKIIKPWKYNDPRHKIFDSLKMPDHSKWQGLWGPEALYIDKTDNLTTGPLGIVWATSSRGHEISDYIRNLMFNVNSQNHE